MFLVTHLPSDEGGFHLDRHNQPYAEVVAAPDSDQWTIDASHETIEMLVDPHGNHLQNSTSISLKNGQIEDGTTQFAYVVEACDPCEADKYAYPIQGIEVSDFITPHFYDSIATPGTRYSFTGAVQRPRQILPGGYISWINHETNKIQQLRYFNPTPKIVTLGTAQGPSLRVWIDSQVRASAEKNALGRHTRKLNDKLTKQLQTKRANLATIAEVRAQLYE